MELIPKLPTEVFATKLDKTMRIVCLVCCITCLAYFSVRVYNILEYEAEPIVFKEAPEELGWYDLAILFLGIFHGVGAYIVNEYINLCIPDSDKEDIEELQSKGLL